MRKLVVGDIHGCNRALLQCLERASFNPAKDRLISLGDACDRGPEVREVLDTLIGIKNLVFILGNHDKWALDWFEEGLKPELWLSQGGLQTMASYGGSPEEAGKVPEAHIEFLRNAPCWHEEDNRLFVHGGFRPEIPLSKTNPEILIWDRELLQMALDDPKKKMTPYLEVFVGHTPTMTFPPAYGTKPLHGADVWGIDTGAGCGGCLTIMDVETKEYWQSDPVARLYRDLDM